VKFREVFAPYVHAPVLNLGCGIDRLPGAVNVDLYNSPDVRMDIRQPWPFKDNSFSTIYASHVFEHFTGEELFPIFWEAGRVLKPGGYLLGVVPYGRSDVYAGNPLHKQEWLEVTVHNFCQNHWQDSSKGMDQGTRHQPFERVLQYMVVKPPFTRLPLWLTTIAGRYLLNVYSEMLFVLQLPVKP
jgi:predicted SAM-dependent methyltransferase